MNQNGVPVKNRHRHRVQGAWGAAAPSHAVLPRSAASFAPTQPINTLSHQQYVYQECSQSGTMSAEIPRFFSWVDDGLCGLAFPEKPENIQYLVDNNVRYLVSLTEERPPPVENFPQLKTVYIKVKDFTPPTLEQVEQFLVVVEKAKSEHAAVAVHCSKGKGRTGTMLACFFIARFNMTNKDAVSHIQKLRRGSVQTAEQKNLVRMFEEHNRRKLYNGDTSSVSVT